MTDFNSRGPRLSDIDNLLQDSIFTSSNGAKLVEYVKKKRGTGRVRLHNIFEQVAATQRAKFNFDTDDSDPTPLPATPTQSNGDAAADAKSPVETTTTQAVHHENGEPAASTTKIVDKHTIRDDVMRDIRPLEHAPASGSALSRKVLINQYQRTNAAKCELLRQLTSSTPKPDMTDTLGRVSTFTTSLSPITDQISPIDPIPELQQQVEQANSAPPEKPAPVEKANSAAAVDVQHVLAPCSQHVPASTPKKVIVVRTEADPAPPSPDLVIPETPSPSKETCESPRVPPHTHLPPRRLSATFRLIEQDALGEAANGYMTSDESGTSEQSLQNTANENSLVKSILKDPHSQRRHSNRVSFSQQLVEEREISPAPSILEAYSNSDDSTDESFDEYEVIDEVYSDSNSCSPEPVDTEKDYDEFNQIRADLENGLQVVHERPESPLINVVEDVPVQWYETRTPRREDMHKGLLVIPTTGKKDNKTNLQLVDIITDWDDEVDEDEEEPGADITPEEIPETQPLLTQRTNETNRNARDISTSEMEESVDRLVELPPPPTSFNGTPDALLASPARPVTPPTQFTDSAKRRFLLQNDEAVISRIQNELSQSLQLSDKVDNKSEKVSETLVEIAQSFRDNPPPPLPVVETTKKTVVPKKRKKTICPETTSYFETLKTTFAKPRLPCPKNSEAQSTAQKRKLYAMTEHHSSSMVIIPSEPKAFNPPLRNFKIVVLKLRLENYFFTTYSNRTVNVEDTRRSPNGHISSSLEGTSSVTADQANALTEYIGPTQPVNAQKEQSKDPLGHVVTTANEARDNLDTMGKNVLNTNTETEMVQINKLEEESEQKRPEENGNEMAISQPSVAAEQQEDPCVRSTDAADDENHQVREVNSDSTSDTNSGSSQITRKEAGTMPKSGKARVRFKDYAEEDEAQSSNQSQDVDSEIQRKNPEKKSQAEQASLSSKQVLDDESSSQKQAARAESTSAEGDQLTNKLAEHELKSSKSASSTSSSTEQTQEKTAKKRGRPKKRGGLKKRVAVVITEEKQTRQAANKNIPQQNLSHDPKSKRLTNRSNRTEPVRKTRTTHKAPQKTDGQESSESTSSLSSNTDKNNQKDAAKSQKAHNKQVASREFPRRDSSDDPNSERTTDGSDRTEYVRKTRATHKAPQKIDDQESSESTSSLSSNTDKNNQKDAANSQKAQNKKVASREFPRRHYSSDDPNSERTTDGSDYTEYVRKTRAAHKAPQKIDDQKSSESTSSLSSNTDKNNHTDATKSSSDDPNSERTTDSSDHTEYVRKTRATHKAPQKIDDQESSESTSSLSSNSDKNLHKAKEKFQKAHNKQPAIARREFPRQDSSDEPNSERSTNGSKPVELVQQRSENPNISEDVDDAEAADSRLCDTEKNRQNGKMLRGRPKRQDSSDGPKSERSTKGSNLTESVRYAPVICNAPQNIDGQESSESTSSLSSNTNKDHRKTKGKSQGKQNKQVANRELLQQDTPDEPNSERSTNVSHSTESVLQSSEQRTASENVDDQEAAVLEENDSHPEFSGGSVSPNRQCDDDEVSLLVPMDPQPTAKSREKKRKSDSHREKHTTESVEKTKKYKISRFLMIDDDTADETWVPTSKQSKEEANTLRQQLRNAGQKVGNEGMVRRSGRTCRIAKRILMTNPLVKSAFDRPNYLPPTVESILEAERIAGELIQREKDRYRSARAAKETGVSKTASTNRKRVKNGTEEEKELTVQSKKNRPVTEQPASNGVDSASPGSSNDAPVSLSTERLAQEKLQAQNWMMKLMQKSSEDTERIPKTTVQYMHMTLDHLSFQEFNGIQYSFFAYSDFENFGFLRFAPTVTKKLTKTKNFLIKFLILQGTLNFTINGKEVTAKGGDFLMLPANSKYIIQNSDEVSLIFMIKVASL